MKEKFQAKQKVEKIDEGLTAEDKVAALVQEPEDPNEIVATLTVHLLGKRGNNVRVEVDDPMKFTGGRFMKHEPRILMQLNRARSTFMRERRKGKTK